MSISLLVICLFPVFILVFMMTKKKGMESYKALALASCIQYGILRSFFDFKATLLFAHIIEGLLTALTPILVIWGAIFLFKTMQHIGAMATLTEWLNNLTPSPVAQLMLVGWAFSFLLEGASGFGTPTAIAAPLLVGLGFPPIRTAVYCLIMNSTAVSFGAMGLAIWFGLGQIGLDQAQLKSIGIQTAFIHFISALIIPLVGLRFILPWSEIRKNISFIYLSILGCMIPYLFFSFFGYELPTIVGGLTGILITTVLAYNNIGLVKPISKKNDDAKIRRGHLIKASFPLWGTVAILLLTRIDELKIKELLMDDSPIFGIVLGSFGHLFVSKSLVLSINNLLGTSISWHLETLYIPSFSPFIIISCFSLALFHSGTKGALIVFKESVSQMAKPTLALFGALVFVKLLMAGGDNSSTSIIGKELAVLIGPLWIHAAAFLGAFGAFFSGSNTISNLTFGCIQMSIAQNLNLDLVQILSLQTAGGSIGTMISISNIVAVCTVLGLKNKEGIILKKTFWPMIFYSTITTLIIYLI